MKDPLMVIPFVLIGLIFGAILGTGFSVTVMIEERDVIKEEFNKACGKVDNFIEHIERIEARFLITMIVITLIVLTLVIACQILGGIK